MKWLISEDGDGAINLEVADSIKAVPESLTSTQYNLRVRWGENDTYIGIKREREFVIKCLKYILESNAECIRVDDKFLREVELMS